MKTRQKLTMALIAAAPFALAQSGTAQQAAQPNAYQGVSQPPADDYVASPDAQPAPVAKPAAGVPAGAPDAGYNAPPAYSAPAYAAPAYPAPIPRDSYAARAPMADPDGDFVRPRVARPGELVEGATIRVRLLDRLSSAVSEKGEPFHGQVASDVLQDGKVMIPAGSMVEGRVVSVSMGHFGGHGSLRLKPEMVILPDGTRFALRAETTGTPGSNLRVGGEGNIRPGSRAKRDGVEYGSVVGAGVIVGAVLAGPIGALTGGLVGAGIVTTHLMVAHPQANLESGSMVLFTLTEPLDLRVR